MKFSIFNFPAFAKASAGKQFSNQKNSGQAALLTVIIIMFLMLSVIFSTAAFALRESKVASSNFKSRLSFFVAEAGVDDAVYRLRRGKNLTSSFTLSIDGASAITNVSIPTQTQRVITSTGDYSGATRAVESHLTMGSDNVSFFYGIQVGDGGLTMDNNAIVNGSVYSNGNVVGSNGAKVFGDVIVAGGITSDPSLSWESYDSDQFFATAASNRDIAQSFITNASGGLSKISLYLGKVGSPGSSINVRIASDNGGKPASSSLANAVIVPSTVGSTPSWINVAFSSVPVLANGSKYWIILDYGSNSSSNYWNWKKDSTDGYLSNTGKYTSDWDSGSASWTDVGGDLSFKVWIGGVNTRIESLTVGDSTMGTGRANLFVDDIVHGSACPNQYCIVDNPSREELPISAGLIEDWRADSLIGGECLSPLCDSSGNFSLTENGALATLGPKKINGSMTVSNNAILTVSGTIYVAGDINFSNNCVIKLSPDYGADSGIIFSDGVITVSNNCTFEGSGDPESFILLLSAKNAPSQNVMNISNNSDGVIYYASDGRIDFANNALAKEATAYGMHLNNNAVINYVSGLANLNFTSGPSGGWGIDTWREVLP
ncbi:hypothetical protein HYW53_03640 [Candidatus Giovannonibacteria bacterium]|nr:hypothetical protein [Candidatus Giovannonibacteria bacterium]